MLIRRHLPNGRSNHGEIAKPLIFKGLTGKYREYDQRLNYRPLYTIYTDSQSVTRSVLESRTWKQEKTNMEIRHIALRLSDLKKQNHRSQQRLKLCSCIVFVSDYQCIRCSASVNRHSVLASRTWKQKKTNRNATAYCIDNQWFAETKSPFLTTAHTLYLHCVYIWLLMC